MAGGSAKPRRSFYLAGSRIVQPGAGLVALGYAALAVPFIRTVQDWRNPVAVPLSLVPPLQRGKPRALSVGRRREGRRAPGDGPGLPAPDRIRVAADAVVSLPPGERICDRLTANHVRDGRVFDGHLYVTTGRLVFVPWEAAVRRGALPFDIPLTDVRGADVAPRSSNWRDGSRRQRLRVTKTSGECELFVVWRPEKAAELVERALNGAA